MEKTGNVFFSKKITDGPINVLILWRDMIFAAGGNTKQFMTIYDMEMVTKNKP